MEHWVNHRAAIEAPLSPWSVDSLMDELQDIHTDVVISARTEGTLTSIELTLVSDLMSITDFFVAIGGALEKFEEGLGEYGAFFVTTWEEHGYARAKATETTAAAAE